MSDPQFSLDALHNVKNHLSVIRGFADLALENAALDPTVRSDILEIRKAAQAALAELVKVTQIR